MTYQKLDSLWERRFESYQLREFFNPDPIVAERLRPLTKIRPTRNQIPSRSVGLNPTNYENFLILIHSVLNICVVDLYWFLKLKIFTLVTGSCGQAVKESD